MQSYYNQPSGFDTQYNQPYQPYRVDSFEQDLSMPLDLMTMDSDISKCSVLNLADKISALTPFSDQFMPSIGHRQPVGQFQGDMYWHQQMSPPRQIMPMAPQRPLQNQYNSSYHSQMQMMASQNYTPSM